MTVSNSLYVKRLTGLLRTTKGDPKALSNTCPWTKRWESGTGMLNRAYNKWGAFRSDSLCDQCRDFVNLNDWANCPCRILGARPARKRANTAIKRWDGGKHKWQKS